MRRREFITLVGGVAAAWPLAAQAQQTGTLRRIGVLMASAENNVAGQTQFAAFRETLLKLGWTDGLNIEFDVRWVGADGERARVAAIEMISRAPDVILAHSAPNTIALKQATARIPIVFASGSDPVRNGLVTNLARPEGNITGFPATEPSLGGKWLELLRTFAPNTTRVAVVESPENPMLVEYWGAAQTAAQGRIVEMTKIEARGDGQIEHDIDGFARTPDGALLILPGPSTGLHSDAIVKAAARHRLPAIYPFRSHVLGGGLMSYGADSVDIFRRAGAYVDRILRGAVPSNLPVQLPTKFELVINLKTAKTSGLTVPTSLLVAADEVIE